MASNIELGEKLNPYPETYHEPDCLWCRIGMPSYYCMNGHKSHNHGDCPYCNLPTGLLINPKLKETKNGIPNQK